MAEIALSFKRMVETSHRHFVSQQTKVQVAKRESKVECEDLELNDICDLIDFEDLAMEDTQSEEYNNNRHHYNTRAAIGTALSRSHRKFSWRLRCRSRTLTYKSRRVAATICFCCVAVIPYKNHTLTSFFESDSLTRHERPQHSLQ
ncbi:hypothetical protein ACLKA6_002813 [Drosophila palustris]